MCDAVGLARSDLPTELIGRHGLGRRVHDRGDGEPEMRFYYRDRAPRLPIWRDGRLQVVRWGNGCRRSRVLPRTGWTWQASIDEGVWRRLEPVLVDVPASLACDRGCWYPVREGIRGLLVPDECGHAVVYVICEPASHYYKNMTRSDRMPMLINERY